MDSFQDSLGTVLHQLTNKYEVPDFVKSASVSDLCPNLPEDALVRVCADSRTFHYPCHTKAATWVSAAYFVDDYKTLSPKYRQEVGANIQKFAKFFGIEPEVQALVATETHTVKSAAAEPVYSDDMYMSVTRKDGQIKRAGLLLTEASLIKAANWLIKNRDRLPLHVCTDISRKIYKRAGALGVKPPHARQLERLLGFGFNDNETIANALTKRATAGYMKNKEQSTILFKIAQEFRTAPPEIGSETMYKAACFLDSYDQLVGLTGKRQRREVSYPEEIFYKHTTSDLQKVASEHIKLQNGSVYSISSLDSLDRVKFEDALGSDLAKECFNGLNIDKEAVARILPTLPRPMAEQVSAMLKDSEVEPVRQEKAASAITIPEEFFN